MGPGSKQELGQVTRYAGFQRSEGIRSLALQLRTSGLCRWLPARARADTVCSPGEPIMILGTFSNLSERQVHVNSSEDSHDATGCEIRVITCCWFVSGGS